MRILYGVVGEGMGHATRSRVVLSHLLASGHEVRVVVSGRAFRFLEEVFADEPLLSVTEIAGLHLAYAENRIDKSGTVRETIEGAPRGVARNLRVYRDVVARFDPEVVLSDFDSFAWLVGQYEQGLNAH
jgi:uncharacterized protein (TIGR00661 family)